MAGRAAERISQSPLLGALGGPGLLLWLDHRLASAHLFGEVKVVGRNRPKPVG